MKWRGPIVAAIVITVGLSAAVWSARTLPAPAPGAPERPEPVTAVEVRCPGVAPEDGGALTGQVMDARGAPVAGATVSLTPQDPGDLAQDLCSAKFGRTACAPDQKARPVEGPWKDAPVLEATVRTQTDARGCFKLTGLSDPSLTVWVEGAGHGVAMHRRVVPGTSLVFKLHPVRSIVGRVVHNPGRSAIEGARVRAVSWKTSRLTEARSDAQGHFLLEGLGEGPFLVVATHGGHGEASVGMLEPGRSPLEFGLEALRTLEVTVQREGRQADATIELATSGGLRRQVVTRGGRATIERLPNEWVMVWARSGRYASIPRWLTAPTLPSAVTLHLWEGEGVRARVVDEAGAPIPSATLRLKFEDGSTAIQELQVDREGKATFAAVGPGPYSLTARAQGFESETREVTLPHGGARVELVLRPEARISGRVLDPHGRGVPNADIGYFPLGSRRVERTDAQGRFTLAAAGPGARLDAYHSEWGRAVKAVSPAGQEATLTLEPGATLAVRMTVRGRPVEGAKVALHRVRDPYYPLRESRSRVGEPWTPGFAAGRGGCLVPYEDPRASLGESEDDWRGESAGHSDQDGWVRMRVAPAGVFEVWVNHPEHPRPEPVLVDLIDGQERVVELAFPHSGSIDLEVVDETGAPVPGVMVSSSGRMNTRTTDANGRAIARAAPEGRGGVMVIHPASRGVESPSLEIQADRVTHARVVLPRAERFRGVVVTRDGKPLPRFTVNDLEFFDPSGRFEVPARVRDGRIWIEVEAPGYRSVREALTATQGDLGTLTL